jgi:hypothetical protein
VGHVNGVKPFIRLNRERVTLSQHSKVQGTNEILWTFAVGLQNRSYITCYNNPRLQNIKIRGIFNDPRECPGFRQDVDMYPMDALIGDEVVRIASNEILKFLRSNAPDFISDGVDKPTR